jgi:hypothetical protein
MWFSSVVLEKAGKDNLTDRVRNDQVLRRAKNKRNIPHKTKEGRLNGVVTSCVGSVF